MAAAAAAAAVPSTMTAFVVGEAGGELRHDVPVPEPREGEALVRVLRAGICNTDLELLKGYKGGYRGVLGHEFVGEVVAAASSPELVGRRVCGELNISCGTCALCKRGGTLARNHCTKRRVLGIIACDGTYAQFLALPTANLHLVPDSVSTEAAAFIEPLAAACRIVEQKLVTSEDRVCVLGDGKLGLLIAEVIARQRLKSRLVLIGRHASKAALLSAGAKPGAGEGADFLPAPKDAESLSADLRGAFDVVVDATGSVEGMKIAGALARAEGTIVLKSTCACQATLDTSMFVVNEQKIIGSRCGPFPEAIRLLEQGDLDVAKYLDAVFPLDRAGEALEAARAKGSLKVHLAVAESEVRIADGKRRRRE